MSGDNTGATPGRPQRQTQRFRRAGGTVLSADQKRRQASVTAAAWDAFGSRDQTISFLNTADARLGGRPLDVALDGDDGLGVILSELRVVANAARD